MNEPARTSASGRQAKVVREISGFTLLQTLGSGAMGKVFLARQESLGRQVALKVLLPELAQDPEFLGRFHREARAAALFQHPNVVGIIDAGQDASTGVNYIALEYVAGGSLEQLLAREGRLDERRSLEVVRAITAALVFAESKGVIHRDIKPDNILLAPDGTPKLADLGLAKQALGSAASVTQTGQVLGTPLYMAPEQALGEEALDARTDLYALGLCWWRMLTGLFPFDERGALNSIQILTAHVTHELPDVRERAPHVSEGVARVIGGMSARDRDARYPTAALLAQDLDRLVAGEPPLGPRGRAEPRRASERPPPAAGASGRRAAGGASSRRAAAQTSGRGAPRAAAGPRLGAGALAGLVVGALALGVGLALALRGGERAAPDEVASSPGESAPELDPPAPTPTPPAPPPPVAPEPTPRQRLEPPTDGPPASEDRAAEQPNSPSAAGSLPPPPVDRPLVEPRREQAAPLEPAEDPLAAEEAAAARERAARERDLARAELLQDRLRPWGEQLLRDVVAAEAALAALEREHPPSAFSSALAPQVEALYAAARAAQDVSALDAGTRAAAARALGAAARGAPGHEPLGPALERVVALGQQLGAVVEGLRARIVAGGEAGEDGEVEALRAAGPWRELTERSGRLAGRVDRWPWHADAGVERGAIARALAELGAQLGAEADFARTPLGRALGRELDELRAVGAALAAGEKSLVVARLLAALGRPAPTEYLAGRIAQHALAPRGKTKLAGPLLGLVVILSEPPEGRARLRLELDRLEVEVSRQEIAIGRGRGRVNRTLDPGDWSARPAVALQWANRTFVARVFDPERGGGLVVILPLPEAAETAPSIELVPDRLRVDSLWLATRPDAGGVPEQGLGD